jgi:cbb3-type cytochrome oxidase subunit 3
VTLGFIFFGIAIIWYRHGPGRPAEADEEADDDLEPDADLDDDFDAGPDRPPGGATNTPDAPTA